MNFKRQKVKLGSFNGLPAFSEALVTRMESEVEELRGFRPAELCNLDYSPARGSAIDPHMDDDWIWGERLVTLNLLSPTYLTFYDNVNSVKSSPSHSGTPTTKVLTFSTLQLYYSEFGHAVKCGRNFACARNPFENLGYAPTKIQLLINNCAGMCSSTSKVIGYRARFIPLPMATLHTQRTHLLPSPSNHTQGTNCRLFAQRTILRNSRQRHFRDSL